MTSPSTAFTPSDLQTLLYEVRDKVAYIVINRPKSMNALSPVVLDELAITTTWAQTDEEVKAIVIRGAGGKAFSAAELKAS